MQSCQPLHLGHSLLHQRALHYTAMLMIISLHSAPPPPHPHRFLISCMHVGLQCTRNQLRVCLFHVCGVGCATANQCSCFKPADHSVQFPLLCVTSWREDFCFQSFQITMPKRKAETEHPDDRSCLKNAHQTFREEYIYRKASVHCMINAERPAC